MSYKKKIVILLIAILFLTSVTVGYYVWSQLPPWPELKEKCYYNYTVRISPPNDENFTLFLPLPVIINVTDWSKFIETPSTTDSQIPAFIENLTVCGNATYDVINTEKGFALKVVGNGKVDIFLEGHIEHQKEFILLSMIHKYQGGIFYSVYSNTSFPSPGCEIYIDWWCDIHLQAEGNNSYFYPGRIICEIREYENMEKEGVKVEEMGWHSVTGTCGLIVS